MVRLMIELEQMTLSNHELLDLSSRYESFVRDQHLATWPEITGAIRTEIPRMVRGAARGGRYRLPITTAEINACV